MACARFASAKRRRGLQRLVSALFLLGLAAPTAIGDGAHGPQLAAPKRSRPAEPIGPGYVAKGDKGPLVVDVRIEGLDDEHVEKVKSEIRTRAGRPLNEKLVEDDVRRLNATRMFLDVRPMYHEVPGGVAVVFHVVERPILHYVEYVGNEKIRDKRLAERTGLKVGDALDPYAIAEGRRKIEELYAERGFSNVRVEVFEGNKKGDRGAVYLIHEGPRQRIRKVEFVGNTITTDARLKTQIQSKPPILWVFKGYADRNKIDEDVDRLTAYYRSLGFFRARIGRELKYDKKNKWVTLTFYIDEGPRYKLRSISFLGNRKFDAEELRGELELKPGDFFDQALMTQDVGHIRERYGSQGYVFADVEADPRFLEQPGELDLVYNIDEGAQYRIGRINVRIEGENPHTRHTTVLNRLSFHPGEIVDIRELRASERRLQASGLFLHQPQRGITPKIVFSPPEADDESLAEKPDNRRRSGFRGQSPDNTTEAGRWRSSHPAAGDSSSASPAPAGTTVAPRQASQPGAALRRWPKRQGQSASALQDNRPNRSVPRPGNSQSDRRPAGAEEMIIRGQYDPFGGGASASPSVGPPVPRQGYPAIAPRSSGARGVLPSPYGSGTASPGQVPSTNQAAPSYAPGGGYPPPAGASGYTAQPAPSVPGAATAPGSATTGSPPPAAAYGTGGGSSAYSAPATNRPAPSATFPPTMQPPGFSGGGAAFAGPPPAAPASPAPGVLPPPDLDRSNDIYPDDGLNFLEPPPRDLDVDVLLQETQTGRLMFGVGVNSSVGLLGNIVIDEQNFDLFRFPRSWDDIRNGTAFRGAGQRLRLEAVPGSQVQRYLFSLTEPYLFDTPISFGISGFFFDRRYREWDEQRLGGRISLGRRLTPDLTATVALSAQNVNVRNPIIPTPDDLTAVLGDNDIYVARFALTHDTRDSTFLPTEGHYIEMAYEQGFGEFDYPRGIVDARQYFLMRQRADRSGRHVVALRGRVGITGNQTPIFERFFAGGFSTIRGFDFRGVSPRVFGVPVGGEFQFLGSAEYLFPITADDMLRGVFFVDFGTVEESVKIVEDNFRVAPGFGLRITVPALGPAPIALDFAVPVAHAAGDEIENFSFFVGLTR